jgi:hypothetical protein
MANVLKRENPRYRWKKNSARIVQPNHLNRQKTEIGGKLQTGSCISKNLGKTSDTIPIDDLKPKTKGKKKKIKKNHPLSKKSP